MSYLGRLVSKTVINGKNKVHYLQTTENCCKKEETIMKKKYFACAMGLVLALSLAACGEEEVIVENILFVDVLLTILNDNALVAVGNLLSCKIVQGR